MADPKRSNQPLDWTIGSGNGGYIWSGSSNDPNHDAYGGHTGSQYVECGATGSSLDTTTYSVTGGLITIPNQTYLFSFYLKFASDAGSSTTFSTGRQLSIQWNGATVGSVSFDNVAHNGPYVQYCLPTLLTTHGGDSLVIQAGDSPDIL